MSLLLVQHLTDCLIWLEEKNEKKKLLNVKKKNLFNRICRSAIRI